jgi:Reverse transcriptase (RNA-dependent DNA polymerase)
MLQSPAARTQSRGPASRGLWRVRQAAKRDKHLRFTALFHHLTPELLCESFYALERQAASEGDGVTWDSYGVRLGRGPHDALDALAVGLVKQKVWWVLDADIQQFYDMLEWHWLRRFLRHRIGDKRLLRLINKWLEIDIIDEGGQKTKPAQGIAQGLVLAPLMSNLYLHYVFDLWSHAWRKKRASGEVIITRFADDIVLGFQYQHEGRTLWTSWPSGSAPLVSPCTQSRRG